MRSFTLSLAILLSACGPRGRVVAGESPATASLPGPDPATTPAPPDTTPAPPATDAPPGMDPAAATPGSGLGVPCPDGRCAPGLTCISYYGVAGPRGPLFSSCEVPCAHDPCPHGLRCVTIADGPGTVCR